MDFPLERNKKIGPFISCRLAPCVVLAVPLSAFFPFFFRFVLILPSFPLSGRREMDRVIEWVSQWQLVWRVGELLGIAAKVLEHFRMGGSFLDTCHAIFFVVASKTDSYIIAAKGYCSLWV